MKENPWVFHQSFYSQENGMNQTKVETFTLSSNPAGLFALINLSIGSLELCSFLYWKKQMQQKWKLSRLRNWTENESLFQISGLSLPIVQLIRVCLCRYGLQWLSKPIVPLCIVLGDIPCVHRSEGEKHFSFQKKGKAVFRMIIS